MPLLPHAGGSRNSNRSVLTRLHALSEAEAGLGRHRRVQEQAQERLRQLASAAQEHNRYAILPGCRTGSAAQYLACCNPDSANNRSRWMTAPGCRAGSVVWPTKGMCAAA